jgi:hypothetical protein
LYKYSLKYLTVHSCTVFQDSYLQKAAAAAINEIAAAA